MAEGAQVERRVEAEVSLQIAKEGLNGASEKRAWICV